MWHVLFTLLVIGTSTRVLVITWIGLAEQSYINVNRRALHGSSLYVAKWAGQVDTCRSEGLANLTDPAFCRHFGQPYATLV